LKQPDRQTFDFASCVAQFPQSSNYGITIGAETRITPACGAELLEAFE
jgi:hypothetical protein